MKLPADRSYSARWARVALEDHRWEDRYSHTDLWISANGRARRPLCRRCAGFLSEERSPSLVTEACAASRGRQHLAAPRRRGWKLHTELSEADLKELPTHKRWRVPIIKVAAVWRVAGVPAAFLAAFLAAQPSGRWPVTVAVARRSPVPQQPRTLGRPRDAVNLRRPPGRSPRGTGQLHLWPSM